MGAGRPTEHKSEIDDAAWDYIKNCPDVTPSVVGLCRHINRARSTVYKWAEEGTGQFSDILKALLEEQEYSLINKGLSGDFNPTITKLILTKHGYSDKVEHDNTSSDGSMSPISTDDREALKKARAEMLQDDDC